jgi:hypothetical protein
MKKGQIGGYNKGIRDRMARRGIRRVMLSIARKYAADLEEMDRSAECGARRAAKERAYASVMEFIRWRGWDGRGEGSKGKGL